MIANKLVVRASCWALLGLGIVAVVGCTTTQSHTRNATSVVDYLYPDAKDPIAEQGMPVLTLPMRIGVAFVPDARSSGTVGNVVMTEARKRQLLDEVGRHFSGRDFIRTIEIIPSAYLRPNGSFANLDQLRTMYGVDVITLVSYDQAQFTDEGLSSLAYWTIIGAYVVRGEKNSTHTMVDAVVLDIPSRKMLFRAPGTSFIKGSATLVNQSEQLRLDAERGFEEAVVQMIGNLDQELVVFQERVKSSPEEYRVVKTAGYQGSGALGTLPAVLITLLLGLGIGWAGRRG
jgi:rhombotail lipoprotein